MIEIYFGSPGSGKTTFLTKFCKRGLASKRYDHVFHNVDSLSIGEYFDFSEIGKQLQINEQHSYHETLRNGRKLFIRDGFYDAGGYQFPEYSLILIDEAGIQFNNRNFKLLPYAWIWFAKLHRHFNCDIVFFSQGEDIDITFRRLCDVMYLVKKHGPWSTAKRIYKKVDIDENSKQLIDAYSFPRFSDYIFHPFSQVKVVFRRFWYGKFDSYCRPDFVPLKNPAAK